ncbi:MAG: alanine racemase [Gemmatimonadota bacterium]
MEERTRRAWVEIDLAALRRNAQKISAATQRPLLPMVKADAYGLGAIRVVEALEPLDPFAYGVATLDEAAELRAAGITRRIFIFTPVLTSDLPEVRRLGITPGLADADAISHWSAAGPEPWHLNIDTGMHRAGIEWWRVAELAGFLARHEPEGAFTHFHSADVDNETFAVQRERFLAAVAQLARRPRYLHAENSPAIERALPGPSSFDLVRPGVFLYGASGRGGDLVSEPVAHVRARIVELHTVRDGETVSYGGTWRADGDRRVATLAIGYADGYRRVFGNRGRVLIRGRMVPVVGRITMDMTMIDVTTVPCETGDIATLMGSDSGALLDLAGETARADLLSYEFLTGLGLRLSRKYTTSG